MRCIHCDYLLFNLTQPVCPECGRGFDVAAYRFEHDAVSFNCPHCDQAYFGNDEQGLPAPRSFDCVQCDTLVSIQELRVVPRHDAAMAEVAGVIPWEGRRPGQAIAAWWATIKMLLFKPTRLFRTTTSRSTSDARRFALVTTYLGLTAALAYQAVFMYAVTALMAPAGGAPAPVGFVLGFSIAAALIMPLIIVFVGAWVLAGLAHLALRFLAPDHRPFEVTLRLTLYSFGANIVYLVPLLGNDAAGIWGLVISIIAIREWHRTTGWRATLAKLWPLVPIIGVVTVVLALVILGRL